METVVSVKGTVGDLSQSSLFMREDCLVKILPTHGKWSQEYQYGDSRS